jgi:hypothetical protein
MRVVKRAVLSAAMVVGWLLLVAQPASAHTVSGVGATNWRSFLTSVSPQEPGLSVKLVEDGSRIEVTNHGPEITVIGYEGEPYLRIGPNGVFENLESPATYLNCTRIGCAIPSGVNKDAPPQWKQISSGQTARWHDHRSHWMGSQLPPDIARAPNQTHVQSTWTIMMTQGPTDITVAGNYTWIPGTSPIPWILVAVVLAAAGAAIGFFGAWGLPLAIAVIVVTANDLYHAVAIADFWSGGFLFHLQKFFAGSFYSIVGWVLGGVGAWLLVRRRVDGLYAAVFAGGSAALFTGLLDFTVLSRSQVPFTASITVDRITVVISLGLGVGVAIGALIALRASRPVLDAEYYDDDDYDGPDTDEPDAVPATGIVPAAAGDHVAPVVTTDEDGL